MAKKSTKTKTIILGISGSVAAYKGCELASSLTQNGFTVISLLTRSAEHFITPLSLSSVTGNPCYTDMFARQNPAHGEMQMQHISLAERAEMIVIAPASADIIARTAQGRASDLLSTVILSTRAPVLFAPAMNANMYAHPLTKQNINVLEGIGYQFIGPEKGRLACGIKGLGRMSDPVAILTRIKKILRA